MAMNVPAKFEVCSYPFLR